ncbi:hypothetical protein D3C80_1176060 [compost metagenome]
MCEPIYPAPPTTSNFIRASWTLLLYRRSESSLNRTGGSISYRSSETVDGQMPYFKNSQLDMYWPSKVMLYRPSW